MNWTWSKYKVIDIQDNVYTVVNEKNESFSFSLFFYDLEVFVGDYLTVSSIYFHKFTDYGLEKYYFGPLNTKFSKKLTPFTDYEKIIIEQDGKEVTYQRYYG